jgi:hypothetical protein
MTRPVVLFCKTYHRDLNRLARLARSIQQYNTDNIPFFVSVPASERELFEREIAQTGIHWLSDEDILRANPRIRPGQVQAMTGGMAQQVVKSEFWRLGESDAYVCLDADAYFIRPFTSRDFVDAQGTPYTVMDQAQGLLEAAMQHGKPKVVEHFFRESQDFQVRMQRQGKHYNFGPLPVVWHRAVWEALDREYLAPAKLSFADAIAQAPIETRWYGESLLRYRPIPILPTLPLFKVYHYAWQYDADRAKGMTEEQLATLYCGVILQSAWDKVSDWPSEPGSVLSRAARRLRRALGRM